MVIDLNEILLEQIFKAYETRFGPLPDAMMANDVISHVCEILVDYKEAA